MNTVFTSFATHNYGGAFNNQKRLSEEAITKGRVKNTFQYKTDDIIGFLNLADKFFEDVKVVYPRLRHSRYFVWKPHIILKTFDNINEGDVVIYHDAGRNCYNYKIDKDLNPFCRYVVEQHSGIFVNFGVFKNFRFTKRDCFEVMNCYEDFYFNHNQANGSWGIYQKTPFVIEFLQKWREYCMHESYIVTDLPSKRSEHPKFDAHRHDQSILTNLLLKYSKHENLKLDPKLTDKKIKKPWGFEKNMCNAINKIEQAYGLI
jgi:hypothetical protein